MLTIDENVVNVMLSLGKHPEWARMIRWINEQREFFISAMLNETPSPTDFNYVTRHNILMGMCTVLDVLNGLFSNPMEALEHIKKIEEKIDNAQSGAV